MKNTILIFIQLLLFFGCREDDKEGRIEIYPLIDSIKIYEDVQLNALVVFSDKSVDSINDLNWQSLDTSIIHVDLKGNITGVGIGIGNIICSYNGLSKQITIKVVCNPLFQNLWILTSFQDLNTNKKTAYPDSLARKVILGFYYGRMFSTDTTDYTLVGFGGICNSCSGRCLISKNKITFPYGIFHTKMYCPDYEYWENLLIEGLWYAYEYSVESEQLNIKSEMSYKLNFDKYIK